jgi:hypothetical protein
LSLNSLTLSFIYLTLNLINILSNAMINNFIEFSKCSICTYWNIITISQFSPYSHVKVRTWIGF